jgi:hypothetical protein
VPDPSFDEAIKRNADRIFALELIRKPSRSEQTELNIRLGIARFASGSTKTDGSWTVVNLVKESGVPRPTLYRYQLALDDFQAAADAAPEASTGLRDEVRRLRAELKAERRLRIDEREEHERIQGILVQRLHAVTLAYGQASGDQKVIDLLSKKQATTNQ